MKVKERDHLEGYNIRLDRRIGGLDYGNGIGNSKKYKIQCLF